MKKDNAILIGIGVAVAGFFGYRYYKKKKDEKDAEAKAAEIAKQAQTPPLQSGGVTTQPTGYSAYQKKVMTLQQKLGIAVDGNPGVGPNSQTNKTVASWFPTLYAKLGIVSVANVDQYIAAKKENTQATASAISEQQAIMNIFAAMKTKGLARFIKDAQVPAYYFDSADNSYQPTGGYFKVKQGEAVYYSGAVLVTGGIMRILPTYFKDGKPAGNKLVKIRPELVYVP